MMEKNQTTKWVFVPVHKTRVIKDLDKAVLIAVSENHSTILPKVFKRKKESDTHIYFSLPENFVMNLRESVYNKELNKYINVDTEEPITKRKAVIKLLDKELTLDLVKPTDYPF